MCLAVPARITAIDESGQARVDYLGSEVRTNLTLLPQAKVGDWVIIHAGFAISLLDEEEARETLRIFREIAERT
jgi:hydrogenase expression/formation protein HypC